VSCFQKLSKIYLGVVFSEIVSKIYLVVQFSETVSKVYLGVLFSEIDLNLQDDQRLKADEKWYSVLIQNVQGNDYGDYYCTGTNEFGTRSAKFTLFGKFYIILKNENKPEINRTKQE
jgi:hypothetical protein